MVKQINLKKKLQAILIKKEDLKKSKNINFFTNSKLTLQVASMKHPKGHKILPHKHNKFLRKIYNTSEALFLIKGKIKVNFFDKNRKFFKKVILETGDIILFYAGTHGFEILKNSQMIEFKQGPYIKKKDKLLI